MSLGIGVIGAGVMGADHARTIAEQGAGLHVAAICDPDRARAEASAARAPGARIETDPHAVIAAKDVDAVLVASPDETHADFTLACIAAGKPVLCEKPLAATIAECARIVEAERAAGRRLVQVGFMRRFDPAYLDMKARHAEGGLGAARLLHCIHRNASAPVFFKGLMAITNAAVHEFDICRWLLDAEVARIHVHRSRPTASGAAGFEDPLLLVLEMDGGQLVDIEVFVNCGYGYDIRTELVCAGGTLSMLPPHLSELRQAGGTAPAYAFAPDWRQRFRDAYRLQIAGWRDAIRTGTPAGASAWDGLVATAVAEAGCKALESGEG
ncbi:MAG: Gfo/Idh/MocA family oxidoreductase, partial [Alphaproteobacteria bacterium]